MSRTRALAAAGLAAAMVLAACGGDDPTPVEVPDDQETADSPGDDEPGDDEPGDDPTETDGPGDDPTETDGPGGDPGADGVPELGDIWDDVLTKAENAESVSMNIVGSMDGTTMDLAIRGQLDDSNFEVEGLLDGLSLSIIYDGQESYIRGDEALWEDFGAPPEIVQDLVGQWVLVPDGGGITEVLSMSSLWGGMFAEIPRGGDQMQTSVAEHSDFEGTPAYRYEIAGPDGEQAEIYIDAANETLTRLHVVSAAGIEEPIDMIFTQWDSVPPIEAPADAVDIEDLEG